MRKVRAGMMDVATATAIPDGRCACSYPAQCPAVFILLSSLTSVALPVRVCFCNACAVYSKFFLIFIVLARQ